MLVDGTTDPHVAPVREAFADVVADAAGTGAAVAAWHDGAWVVDLWGGWADAGRTRLWEEDSIVQPYSVSKPFAALCALMLFDWDGLCARLARQEPLWPPGTAHGESALFYGHLVGELVRRVDGRTPGRFLREEIGLDFAFGLTADEQARAVDVTGLDESFARQNLAGKPEIYPRAIGNPPGARDAAVVNSPAWRAAEIPSINGHGTARGAAGLYAALLEGELLSAELLAEATRVQSAGVDRVFGEQNAWGLGFLVDDDGFGMGGTGGSVAVASTVGGYAFAFVTGSMGDHARAEALENELRACLGLSPLEPGA